MCRGVRALKSSYVKERCGKDLLALTDSGGLCKQEVKAKAELHVT